MKIFFLSCNYPIDGESEYASHAMPGGLSIPSNVFQWSVIRGLVENGANVMVASYPSLPTFPHGYNRPFTRNLPICYDNRIIGTAHSYCTVIGLKELSIMISVKRAVRQWIKTLSKNEPGIVLIYGIYGPSLKAAVQVSRSYHNVHICPIATDLFISSLDCIKPYSLPKKIQGYFEYKAIEYGLDKADTFILLAKGMVKFIPRAVDNHIIVEGIAGDNYPKPTAKRASEERVLLYTGSLAEHTSVKELVDAFMLTTNPRFRLQICGAGLYGEYIHQKSREDNRIQYFGPVGREKSLELQRKATLLINPRLPSVPDTPYSFPSKTIEYLASGTPMIGYKLEGITEDYYKFFYIPKDDSIESLSELITDALQMPQSEHDQKALEAWEFVTSQKNASRQMKRFVDFIEQKFL